MSIELVTGRAGSGHISSADVGRLIAGIVGKASYYIGDVPGVTMQNTTTFYLGACDLVLQGRHVRIEDSITTTVEAGSSGAYRHDLVYVHYTTSSTKENVTLAVRKGTVASSASAAKDPSWSTAKRTILDEGGVTVDIPIARVKFAGTATSAEFILPHAPSLSEVKPKQNTDTSVAEEHNMHYSSDDITSLYKDGTLFDRIETGTFKDIYPGQTFKAVLIDTEYTLLVLGLDHYMNYGDTPLVQHHIVVCPLTHFGYYNMNNNATTEGGYLGSQMYTTYLPQVKVRLQSAFGNRLIPCRKSLASLSSGTQWFSWEDSYVDLMSQKEVLGVDGEGTSGLSQLPAFMLKPDFAKLTAQWWLREIYDNSSETSYCVVNSNGQLSGYTANYSAYLRPYFLLG